MGKWRDAIVDLIGNGCKIALTMCLILLTIHLLTDDDMPDVYVIEKMDDNVLHVRDDDGRYGYVQCRSTYDYNLIEIGDRVDLHTVVDWYEIDVDSSLEDHNVTRGPLPRDVGRS